MTPLQDNLCKAFVLVMGLVAFGMVVAGPVRATTSWQPALVSDQAASRLAPAGVDQARGGGR